MSDQSIISPQVAKLLKDINHERRLRVWSIVITVFGDCLVPRNGEITLASLQRVFSLFDIEANALRTALSRLANDGWLARNRFGRQSTYQLARNGAEDFRSATDRIYGKTPSDWDGEFELHIQSELGRKRQNIRNKELIAAGFGTPLPGVFIRPKEIGPEVHEPLFLMRMQPGSDEDTTLRSLVSAAWPVDELNQSYVELENRVRSMSELIDNPVGLAPCDYLVLRILLIHEWRRVLLKDVDLPEAFKPANWRGELVRDLVARLYISLFSKSEAFLDNLEARPNTPLPNPDESVLTRFRK